MKRRGFLKITTAGSMIAGSGIMSKAEQKIKKPNFVIIFIDDLGYGDIEPFGSKINHTPQLNRMASEGMKLTSFYVAGPVCSPSRSALMTGSYPKRVGLAMGSWHVVLMPGDTRGLNPEEITIAEVLKSAGYTTGCFGKWHLGDQKKFLPTNQGFDYYYGIPYSNDMWVAPNNKAPKHPPLPLIRNTEPVGEVRDAKGQAGLCRKFTEEAVNFIKKNKNNPFFVYLPHAFVHHPRCAREEFVKRAKKRFNAEKIDIDSLEVSKRLRMNKNDEEAKKMMDVITSAQIEEVDWSAGEILKVLRDLKLDRNTFVFFTSDNGGARGCVNLPLRGGKGTTFEGGMRVPAIAWWPESIPSGSVCDEVASTMDFMPTFARMAGTKVPEGRIIDGKDITDLFFAKPGAKSPHNAFYYYKRNDLSAVRSGKWKLFANGELYNLDEDISETKNVADKYPETVKQLNLLFEHAREDLGDGDRAGKNCRVPGKKNNSRTILPRPDREGDAVYAPSFWEQPIKKKRKAKKK